MVEGWTREETWHIAYRAWRLYREGRLGEAAILFEGLLAIDPENAYCRKGLAAICMGRRQYDSAIAHLDTVLAREPRDAEALAARASLAPQLPAGAPDNSYGW
jgi:tetratricopeptide (TPR) repeat protein